MRPASNQGERDYRSIFVDDLRAGSPLERMDALVDRLWDSLSVSGVSWIGVYLGPGFTMDDGRIVGADEMLLGPNRPKPACSPIALHGACGQVWKSGEPLVVHDVKELGERYVACDPRDASEVVVPLLDDSGACWGVLDADSWEVGAFTAHDACELERLCRGAGLTH